MKRTFFTLVLACLVAGPVFAQEEGEKPAPTAPEKPAPAPPEKPVSAPSEKPVDDEPVVDEPVVDDTEDVIFERLVGLYFEGRGGVFFTVGGARGYSNGQPFFGFELGYDVTERLSIQFGYASGYQAANPLKYPEDCHGGTECNDYHLDFGLTFFNLSADYDFFLGRRWAVEGRLGGGAVIIDPSAKPDQSPDVLCPGLKPRAIFVRPLRGAAYIGC
jgi:hypothetical protein